LDNLVSWQRYVDPLGIPFGPHFMVLIFIHCLYALEQVFSIFEDLGISVDCVATSEVSISVTLDPSKIWSRELIQQASAAVK
jgi:hypothetical protein